MRLSWFPWYQRRAREADLARELRNHLELESEEQRDAGLSADEAEYAAHRSLGNTLKIEEDVREAWGFQRLETFVQDVRYGLRMLRKSPGFTAVAVLTLALGIGANTAIFSVIEAVLLRPLPFHDPNRVVQILETAKNLPYTSASGEDYLDWESQNHSLEASSITTWAQSYDASGAGRPETVTAVRAEADFFSVLGTDPLLGRGFARGEDRPGKDHVAVLSYGFWQRHFAGNRHALGATLQLNFQPYTIVGVMPREVNYPQGIDVWIPIDKTIAGTSPRGNYSYRVIGRLKPGVTIEQANADLSGIADRLARTYPDTNKGRGARVVALKTRLTQDSRPQLLLLLGAVALVLLVACANVANLLLLRAARREREMSLRRALGAGRARLLRQLLSESVILSLAGAALGLAVASWCVNVAQSTTWLPIPRQNAVQLNIPVLLFTLTVSLVVGVLFGLAPALQSSRVNLSDALRGSRTVAGAAGWRSRLRDGLVVAEIATSLALLVGAGLLLQTFARMRTADIGVVPQNVLTMQLQLPDTKYANPPARRAFYDQLLARVQAVPDVRSAALAQTLPLEGDHTWSGYPQGASDWRASLVQLTVNFVTPDYFKTMGIPVQSGRTFASPDFDRALVSSTRLSEFVKRHPEFQVAVQPELATSAIISRSAAQGLWPNQDPVDRVFISGNIPVHVIGVVGDVKETDIRDAAAATPQAYFPYTQDLDNSNYPEEIVAKTSMAPEAAASAIRDTVQQLDSGLPVFDVRTMQAVIAGNMQGTALETSLLAIFAGLALLLAMIGVYGVMAYLVTQRRHELGMRMALGARPRHVLSLVMGHGARLAAIGAGIGTILALALSRFLASVLYGVTPTDAPTFAAVIGFLAAVALLACYIPSRRAINVDPLIALRSE
jgi:predicted permease